MLSRYEFREGRSSKFWQIDLGGKSFKTTYGRIGTDGSTTLKEFDSVDEARKQHDKLIAQKLRKGYVEVVAPGLVAPPPAPRGAAALAAPARAAAAPVAAPVDDGWQRYEYVEGRSAKFWEIKVEGKRYTARYGRIGAEGKVTVKESASASQARTAADKLIGQKVEKGYQVAGTATPSIRRSPALRAAAARSARNPELLDALYADPSDEEAYLVYADWLQTQGDPRGELITVQHSLAQRPGDRRLKRTVDELLETHGEALLPPKVAAALERWKGRKAARWETGHCELEWHYGFVRKARLARESEDDEDTPLEELVDEFLQHPSACLLQELTIGRLGIYDQYDYGSVVSAIASARPLALRKLYVADFHSEDTELSWSDMGTFARIWAVAPNLEDVTMRGGGIELGRIDAPKLRSFRVETGGLPASAVLSIANARWPNLESLHIYFGADNYGAGGTLKMIAPILAGQGLPKLRHLGLMDGEFADEICAALPRSKILPQLETLDLSLGTMGDEGARAILERPSAFSHLELLDVSENFISDGLCESLSNVCAQVVIGDQEAADDDDDYRYVSVGE